MKNKILRFYNEKVHPGEKTTLALPLPELYSCSPMYMPLKIMHGKESGPKVLIFAMTDGAEFNGLEIINRLFSEISPSQIKGTIIAVPVLNVYGLTHYPKISPSGISMTDCFPGDQNGTFSERIANIFTQEILKDVDYCIELQTGSINHEALPQIYCNFEDKSQKDLAKNFQAPVITELDFHTSKLRETIYDLNIPFFVYEAGEAMRLDQVAIQIGLDGIQNLLSSLDMMQHEIHDNITPVFSKNEDWLVAHSSGILSTDVSLGQHIKAGEKIGRLSDPFNSDNTSIMKSENDGIVVGVNRSPLIQEGDSIFKIASFIDNDRAENLIEEWDEYQSDLIEE